MNEITYFVPFYAENIGSITMTAWENGEETQENITCRAYLAKLCRKHAVDSIYSRDKYGRLLGCVNCVPIPLSGELLLIPLKVRKPICKSDGAMGYVNFHHVTYCEEDNNGYTDIILKNGKRIKILSRLKTVRRNINDAAIINDHYKKEKGIYEYHDILGAAAKAMVYELIKEFIIKNGLNRDN